MADHEKYMAMAIQEAEDGVRAGFLPYGGIIVKDGQVIGKGRSTGIVMKDPTAQHMGTGDMRGCVMYANCDPCPMCAGAAMYSGIGTVVIGAGPEALRRYSNGRYDLRDYTIERVVELSGLDIQVIRGILEERAEEVFKAWRDWDLAAPSTPPG